MLYQRLVVVALFVGALGLNAIDSLRLVPEFGGFARL